MANIMYLALILYYGIIIITNFIKEKDTLGTS